MFETLMNNVSNFFEYAKKSGSYIYNNYNYKQIILIFLVFLSVYLVEYINGLNINFGLINIPQQVVQNPKKPTIPSKKSIKK
jgi:hypothetical protein